MKSRKRLTPSKTHLDWWKSLPIDEKIQCKYCFVLLCGAEFQDIVKVLDYNMTIRTLYNKMLIEDIIDPFDKMMEDD